MSDNAIEVRSLCKTFKIDYNKSVSHTAEELNDKRYSSDKIEVLNDISFEVKKGEMFGIVGRNGIGKTTLLRIIAGIYKPDSGTVKVDGSLIPLLSLGTGFDIELDAKDNIIMYGKILGFSDKEIQQKILEILRFAELEKFANVKLKKFSTGMVMRLAFTTAMQIDPDIILVDEILGVGDVAFQKKSYDAFMSFRQKKKTIVYVSQDVNSINTLCNRAMLLNKGRIESIGSPSKVVNDYLGIFEKPKESIK
jgi:ABC-type polysaccharide/polyol phosphate transport system ATPase subunit